MMKKARKIIEIVLKGFLNIIINISCAFYKRFPYFFLNTVCDVLQNKTGAFISYKERPLKSEKMVVAPLYKHSNQNTAVILQGPLCEKDNFTVETVKYYARTMPDALLIVSTWENSDINIINSIKELGACVVLSKTPEFTGRGNINYQVVSTRAGIEEAKRRGMQYVMKTRTDQRICSPDFLNYCFSLLKTFPVGDEFAYLNQQQRIIVGQGSGFGSMFIPFFISDFFYFGKTDTLLKLFSIEMQKINQTTKERFETHNTHKIGRTIAEYYAYRAPEIALIKNYISDNGKRNIKSDVKTYWKFVKNNLITVSHSEIQILWPKYAGNHDENRMDFSYVKNDNDKLLLSYTWTFSRWLNLYSGEIVYSEEFEYMPNLPADML